MKKSTIWFLFILSIAGWVFFGETMILPGSMALAAPDGATFMPSVAAPVIPAAETKSIPLYRLQVQPKLKVLLSSPLTIGIL